MGKEHAADPYDGREGMQDQRYRRDCRSLTHEWGSMKLRFHIFAQQLE